MSILCKRKLWKSFELKAFVRNFRALSELRNHKYSIPSFAYLKYQKSLYFAHKHPETVRILSEALIAHVIVNKQRLLIFEAACFHENVCV